MHANTLDAVWAFAQMNQRVLAEPIELPPSVAKESLGAYAELQSLRSRLRQSRGQILFVDGGWMAG
jgi:hypothetical protein